MKLMLAENAPRYATLAEAIEDNYISVPDPVSGRIVRVREDVFDELPWNEWNEVMDALQPYNDQGVNGFLSKWKEKRAEKKEIRAEKKEAKAERRQENKAARRDLIRDLGTKIAGAFGGGGSSDLETRGVGITGGIDFGTTQQAKPWYTNPVVIGGGVLALGTLVYFLTRKKRK